MLAHVDVAVVGVVGGCGDVCVVVEGMWWWWGCCAFVRGRVSWCWVIKDQQQPQRSGGCGGDVLVVACAVVSGSGERTGWAQRASLLQQP